MKNKTLQKGGESLAATPRAQSIKLGLDVHADSITAVRIVDGQSPQPPQRFSPEKFRDWVRQQRAAAEKVYACYEAGPLGYGLQREMAAMGAVCHVVRPRDWDQYGSKVKTDGRDAHELALCLDRYVSGNTRAFSVVRVPTPEEEQRRSLGRHRGAMLKEVQRLAQEGRGTALYYGHRLQVSRWWGAGWAELEQTLPPHLARLLGSLRAVILAAEKELKSFTRQIEKNAEPTQEARAAKDSNRGAEAGAAAPPPLPAGIGRLTAQLLEGEVADWSRFKNRRQVASYTGLCPTEDSSGPRRFQGHINKHGNRRLRPLLIECAWRLCRFQPDYRLVRKWQPHLTAARVTSSRRKTIIAAMARQFAVDWWRIRTGRVQASDLGLV